MSDIKQKIVLSNLLKQDEYLKTCAKFNQGLFATRIMRTLEVAKYMLQLSGLVIKKEFINNQELAAALFHEVKSIKYFENYTYKDVIGLLNSVNNLRLCIVGNEQEEIKKLASPAFKKKNDAVISFYEKLKEYLDNNNKIDEVGIVRYAYNNTKSFDDIEFVRYDNELLLPLEIGLLNKAAGKEVEPIALGDNSCTTIKTYTKAFGQVNEIERILDYIIKNNIPFDECVIAAAELKDYSKILSNYRDVLDIPLTIGGGTSLLETNPGRVLSTILEWKDGHRHCDFFKKLVFANYFDIEKLKENLGIPSDFEELNEDLEYPYLLDLDTVIEMIGDLKFDFDEVDNNQDKLNKLKDLIEKHKTEDEYKVRAKALPFIEAFVKEINSGLSTFIEKHTLIDLNNEGVERSALEKIKTLLSYVTKYKIPFEDVKKILLTSSVGSEKAKAGYLHVTTIDKSVSCLRKHLFVVGLSSNSFPGKSVEDPIIMDIDYEKYGLNAFSNNQVIQNKNNYFALLALANQLGAEVHVSYAFYNSETLKNQNASSVIFETYKKEYGEDKTLKDLEDSFKNETDKFLTVTYFDSHLLASSNVGKVVSDNKTIVLDENIEENDGEEEIEEEVKDADIDFACGKRGFSASAVGDFAHCPYLFMLKYVLGVKQPEETDVYEIIDAASLGTMAHSLLETLDKKKTTQVDFVNLAKQRFDEFLITHPADNPAQAKKAKDDFVDMMAIAYEMDDGAKTMWKEKDISMVHKESGIRIHGLPDKVIQVKDGLAVIDYKTGRTVKHDVDDIASMTQCTMYSYLVKNRLKQDVKSFEYRYIRLNERVLSSQNDHDMAFHYQNLTNTLVELSSALKTGIFTPKKNYCESCYFKDVCKKK